MNPTRTGQRPLVVLVDDDPDYASVIVGRLKARFPGVDFFHSLTGSGLLEKMNGEGLRPDVVVMDYDLHEAGDWTHGPTWTKAIRDLAPETVIIGNTGEPDKEEPPTYKTRRQLFLEAGAETVADDKSSAVLAEILAKHLPPRNRNRGGG